MATDRPAADLSADVVAVGQRDREAFGRVYQRTSGRLFALCLRITGQRSSAEDVLQETFIKIWNRAPGYDPRRASAFPWLAAIARNSAIDWYRAHHRHRMAGEDAIFLIADEAATSEDRIIHEQENERAFSALDELPDNQVDDIRSVYFLGLTYAELAARDEVPVATLKSRIRRALLATRSKLQDD